MSTRATRRLSSATTRSKLSPAAYAIVTFTHATPLFERRCVAEGLTPFHLQRRRTAHARERTTHARTRTHTHTHTHKTCSRTCAPDAHTCILCCPSSAVCLIAAHTKHSPRSSRLRALEHACALNVRCEARAHQNSIALFLDASKGECAHARAHVCVRRQPGVCAPCRSD